MPRKAAFDDIALCLDCRGNLVADARSGDLICEDCALLQGGSLNVVECRHDFFHDGGPLETVSYEAPPQQPSCKVPWFSQVNWTPSALPALCRSERGETGDEGPKVLRKIGKKVNEELAQANQIVELLGLPAVRGQHRERVSDHLLVQEPPAGVCEAEDGTRIRLPCMPGSRCPTDRSRTRGSVRG